MATDFEQPLLLSTEEDADDGSAVVIGLEGELDPHTSPQLEDAISTAIERGRIHVALDLTHLRFLDSSGLRVVIGSHTRLADAGGQLVLRNPNEMASRLLDVTNLRSHLVVED